MERFAPTLADPGFPAVASLIADNGSTDGSQDIARKCGAPKNIQVDNGSEFYSKAMDRWAYRHGVQLEFIRPGRPMDNGHIDSFNGKLRDECLNVNLVLHARGSAPNPR